MLRPSEDADVYLYADPVDIPQWQASCHPH
jgi:hypothetical protein